MEKINSIGTDLFNKIRGRFSNVVIGDADGNVVDDPADARFFDFEYTSNNLKIGQVSVSITDEDLTIIFSKDVLKDKPQTFKEEWYNFLKELRKFAKRRLLQFDVRDITKTNLTKRDYKFLANTRSGEDNMNESKLYGTSHTSYQRVDNARIVIKHATPINTESAASRTQHISAIYIESAEGERFKYPYKHLSGARAMARHVSEGGKQYDDFGSHIVSLSEEMHKLRKFKSYMNKSNVMAESLVEYVDIVNSRIAEVKKTIERLHKPAYYKEAIDGFEKPILEDVPSDVADSWIDQLTIKQFNEELKDVFPYIYRLVGEAKKAETVTLEDIVDEATPCWKNYKQIGMKEKNGKKVPNCVPEEIELEQAFEAIMGQFAEAEDSKKKVDRKTSSWRKLLPHADYPEQANWPFVKFREFEINGKKLLQAVVSVSAPTPQHFKSNSPDVLKYTIGPPKANSKHQIFDPLDRMLRSLKIKNNTTGITVVKNSFLRSEMMQEKYPFLHDWMNSKTQAELRIVDDTSESPETVRKRKLIILVNVEFSNGETEMMDSEILMIKEYFDGQEEMDNPFVQGTPVVVMGPKYTDSIRANQEGKVVSSKEFDLTQPTVYANVKFDDSKVEAFKINQLEILGNANYSSESLLKKGTQVRVTMESSPRKGQVGTVEHSWEEDPNKLYANQKFKDIKAKKEQPNEKIIVQNTKIFDKLRKEYNDTIFKKYFRPKLGGFSIPPEQLENFKSIVYSPEFEKYAGNPQLLFLSAIKSDDELPMSVIQSLPPQVVDTILGKAEFSDDNFDGQHSSDNKIPTGAFSNNAFKNLISKLLRAGLANQLRIELEDFKNMEKLGKDQLKTYMDELDKEMDPATAKDISAEIIMLQDVFPSLHAQRQQNIIELLRLKKLDEIKSYMKSWYRQVAGDEKSRGTPLVADPAIPAPAPKKPKLAKEPKAQSIGPDPLLPAFNELGKLLTDNLVSLERYKEHAKAAIKNDSAMPKEEDKKLYQNRIDQKRSKVEIYDIFKDLILQRRGDKVINTTLPDGPYQTSKDIEVVRKNKHVRGRLRQESIEEAKDYNFTADDIAQIAQISDINIAKQQALKLITSASTRPMTKQKIGYFTNAIQSKKNINALIKMLYDMLLSGEKLGVIGTASSIEPSKYRKTFGEETVESNLEENWKAIALALGLGLGGYHMLDTTSAKNTPLGQALQAAAEQGDERAAKYLSQLDGLIDANNNGAIQHIAKQYPPANESKEEKKSKKVPFTEFIMSHFDRETGQFPKGETALLTMIEKSEDYGEKYIEPAKQFIERLTALHDEYQMRNHPQQLADNAGLDRIKALAGL